MRLAQRLCGGGLAPAPAPQRLWALRHASSQRGPAPRCNAAAAERAAAENDAQTPPLSSPPSSSGSSSAAKAAEAFPEMVLDLPLPQNTRVKSATFVKSSTKTGDCPPETLPEFAVIGRSNVGKSSLINMLTSSKSLALVSKEPGARVRVRGGGWCGRGAPAKV
jgi:hypothetical protein